VTKTSLLATPVTVVADGDGELVADGDGELVADGDGELVADGDGELVADGDGELVADGGIIAPANERFVEEIEKLELEGPIQPVQISIPSPKAEVPKRGSVILSIPFGNVPNTSSINMKGSIYK
jgi:hypothetical protein